MLRHLSILSITIVGILALTTSVSAATLVNLDKKAHTISVEYPEGKIETITLQPGAAPTDMCDGCVLIMKGYSVEFEILEGEKVAIENGAFIYLPN